MAACERKENNDVKMMLFMLWFSKKNWVHAENAKAKQHLEQVLFV